MRDFTLSNTVSVSGNSTSTFNGQSLNVVSGNPTIYGSSNSVVSSANDVGIYLADNQNAVTLFGAHDTLSAGLYQSGGANGDSLLLVGNNNTIMDGGFGNGGVTINGSYNNFVSQQRIETTNILVNGSNDTVSAMYVSGNFVINGDNALIIANNGNFTINGANDTVRAANATSIIVTGSNDTVVDQAQVGSSLPVNLFAGAGAAASDTTAGSAITVTGANDSVTALNNNNSITATGDSVSVSLQSYGNSATVSGNSSNVTAQTSSESISISGANSTVSTAVPISGSSGSTSVAATTVSIASSVAASTTFNNGSSSIVDTTPGSGASTVNITSGSGSVVATAGGTYNDLSLIHISEPTRPY